LQHPDSYSSTHLYVIRLQLEKISKSKLQIFEALQAKGIGVSLHYIPIHIQPYYQGMGFKIGDFPKAEEYYAQAISLPIHQTLGRKQQRYITQTLRIFLGA
jgi:dTDP-4-amino-4,6-dideoxygalactose transaminase